MTKSIYCVYDLKAESIVGGLILENHDAPAIRAFHDALDPKHNTVLSQHPSDFILICLGNINLERGVIQDAGGEYTVIAQGSQWAAATQPLTQEN